ncbi:MAG: alpha/beta fold hydrolase [Gammaproteobacteria bacterium]
MPVFKQPLVFFPGWGFSASIWDEQVASLQSNYDVIACDLPNITVVEIESLAEHFYALIPKESILVGWSLGGLVAMQLQSQYPKRFNQCITIGTTPRFIEGKGWPGVSSKVMQRFYEGLKHNPKELFQRFCAMIAYPIKNKTLLTRLVSSTEQSGLSEASLHGYLKLLETLDMRDAFQRPKVSTRYFFSESDAIVPSEVANRLPSEMTTVIPNACHAPFLTGQLEIKREIS